MTSQKYPKSNLKCPKPRTTVTDKFIYLPRFLSRVFVNWFRAGGTFNLWFNTRRWRWMRTYLGHFTNLWRSRLGGSAPPIPNCFGLFSNNGFTVFSGTCWHANTIKILTWQHHWQKRRTTTLKSRYTALKLQTIDEIAYLLLLHWCWDSGLYVALLGSLEKHNKTQNTMSKWNAHTFKP